MNDIITGHIFLCLAVLPTSLCVCLYFFSWLCFESALCASNCAKSNDRFAR